MPAPIPENETGRIRSLHSYNVLDTADEQAFDDLAKLAAYICDTPIAMISFIDSDRQWFKSELGSDLKQTPRDEAFCAHAILADDLFVVPDTLDDARFTDFPMVSATPAIRFYAGAPLVTPDGYALGTICTLDRIPRVLTPQQADALRMLARQTMAQMELRRSLQKQRELAGLRDSLVAMLVHDLRTPLTALLTGLQTVSFVGDLNPPQTECLELSVRGGKTLLRMVNDMLDVSKTENGRLELTLKALNPGKIVEEALQQTAGLGSKITVTNYIAEEMPQLIGDQEKLVRMLVNLLGNAIKFTPAGGRVHLAVEKPADQQLIVFSVSDTGEGIPAEDFDLIFQTFGQVDTRKAGRSMSTGLGLAFCKMVVEAHNGRISVDSKVGMGSTFRVSLPLNPDLP